MRNNSSYMVIVIVLVMAGTAILNYFVTGWQFEKKYAWVNVSKVYQEFALKKDLEKQMIVTGNARKNILDSMELELKIIGNKFESLSDKEKDRAALEFQTRKQEYLVRKQEFDEDNERLQMDYNEQILKQINQYVKELAIEKDYYMVFGAEGSGTLMYAKETIDITDEAVAFINKRYNGSK